jgi:acyl-homoserine lactone acylase PvdQ
MTGIRLIVVACAAAITLLAAPLIAAADVPAGAYQQDSGPWFRDVLPPGANGLVNPVALTEFLITGVRPPHSDDQLAMYGDLVHVTPGLTADGLAKHFKDSSFGIAPGDAAGSVSPRGDVTIVRDKAFGVPHIYASTRSGAMFGEGYAAAQDRLFFIDVLRHLGRAQLASFAGGAPGNRAFDASQWAIAPYRESDLQAQIDNFPKLYGAEGRQLRRDLDEYVAGVNQYIAEAKLDPTKMPGEYAAIGRPLGPDGWKETDVVATASLVGGIFGKGGGRELQEALLLQAFQSRFGAKRGRTLWYQFAAYDDPDAPTTVRGRRFPYQRPPKHPAKDGEALPDRGSLELAPTVVSGPDAGQAPVGGGLLPPASAPAGGGSPTVRLPVPALSQGGAPSLPGGGVPALPQGGAPAAPGGRGPAVPLPVTGDLPGGLDGLIALPRANSNALLVSARRSASGHPLAVFGPQVGYFAPQILMEQDVHAPTVQARGAAFPGVNLFTELGHGPDYAWSATSAGQDIIDTFAVPLCDPDGGRATTKADHYRFRGRCLPVETLTRTNTWTPNPADQTPAGTEVLRTQRTRLGLVTGRGTVKGVPVVFTQLRSTYRHEVDSARGFSDFNDPAKMRDARDFQRAAAKIGYTFNWLYVDDRHVAYFNSGDNPVRARGTTGQLPMPANKTWKGFDPRANTAAYTPPRRHPQLVDGQDYVTSWNNRQAPGYAGADSNLFSSAFRSDMLDTQIEARLRGGRKMTLPNLVDAMEEAGTTDLRGLKDLPRALEVIGTPSDPRLAGAVAKLRAWRATGAHRIDRNRDGVYDDAEAIRIMDAWWPFWVRAQFEPVMGHGLFAALTSTYEIDNTPNNHGDHLGSAYQEGFYGYVLKDLDRVLGHHVTQPYARGFCGGGRLASCRAALTSSLEAALAVDAKDVYGDDQSCPSETSPDIQYCHDEVRLRPLGAATQPPFHWINRPTYQQAVEIGGHRRR